MGSLDTARNPLTIQHPRLTLRISVRAGIKPPGFEDVRGTIVQHAQWRSKRAGGEHQRLLALRNGNLSQRLGCGGVDGVGSRFQAVACVCRAAGRFIGHDPDILQVDQRAQFLARIPRNGMVCGLAARAETDADIGVFLDA